MNHAAIFSRGRTIALLLAGLGAASSFSAHAETEVEALKRELAEQRALIEKLLATQNSQKAAIEKIEARPAQAATPAAGLPQGLTLYGTLDVNAAASNSGYGRKTTLGSGGMTATSIGLKGQKQIADGLRVVGEVEMGIDLTTGDAGNGASVYGVNNRTVSSGGFTGTGSNLFSRQAYAGLSSDAWGSLTVGRQYSGSYIAAAILGNALGPGFYGSSATWLPIIGGMPTRLNNSAVYRSPSYGGFNVHATYTVGNENNVNSTIVSGASSVTDSSGAGWDMALLYRSKTLNAALTTWDVKNAAFNHTGGETGLARKTGWQAVVNYDLGPVKLYGTWVAGKISGGNYQNVTQNLSKADGWSISAGIPWGRHTVLASYARLDDESLRNRDGSLAGIAYTYRIHDTTWLYANYGRQSNNRNASYSLLNGGDLVGQVARPGYNPDGFMVGLNTRF